MMPFAAMRMRNAGAAGGDPYFAYVVSLINDFGADGSTDWTDEMGHVWTPTGSPVVDRDNPAFPDGAILHNGSTDYIDAGASSDFTFPGAFCWEVFLEVSPMVTNRAICSVKSNWTWYVGSSGNIYFYDGSSNVIAGGAFPDSDPGHLALTRDASNNLRMWHHGLLIGSSVWAGDIDTTNFRWGAATGTPTSFFNGPQGRRRITNGVPRYTVPFTPPTGPFPNY